MLISPRRVALSLWTLRRHLQTADEIARSFARVRELGYEQVELSGVGEPPAAELRQQCDAAGLRVLASRHEAGELLAEPAKIADRLATLGCRLAVYRHPRLPFATLDDVRRLADELSRAGEVLRSRGRLLVYHNQALELRKLEGKAALDWLYELADPFMVHAALDTYFVQLGGGDPAAYAARLSGRLPLLRLKDYALSELGVPQTAALGEGNLNLPIILREAEAAACEHYLVEQDPAPDVDAFAEVAKSLRYLESR